jgi:hypothetical protein
MKTTLPSTLQGLRRLVRLGPAAWVALALLALTAVLALGLTPAWRAQAEAATAEADTLQRQLQHQLQRARTADRNRPAARSVSDMRATLPEATLRQELLADLLALALRHGVSVAGTELRVEIDAALGIERYRIVMPARGGYAELRSFIDNALLSQPALSLDDLQLQRRSATQGEIEAQLQWSLHLRRAGTVTAQAR